MGPKARPIQSEGYEDKRAVPASGGSDREKEPGGGKIWGFAKRREKNLTRFRAYD